MSVRVPKIMSTMGTKAFAYRGPVHWNGLPGNLKLINKIDLFTNEIKKRATNTLDNHPV